MAIKTLTIQNYRSIRKLSLPLDNLNVVTGSNGCGKSNLYKAVHLLAKAAHGNLSKTLALEGGMPCVLWAGNRIKTTKKEAELITLSSRQSQMWVTTHPYELAKMIATTSGSNPINLIRTEEGTQIAGIIKQVSS
jgi:predicted ATPase